jgi:hypothetical protein
MNSPFPSVVVTEILSPTSVRVSGSGEDVSPSTFRVIPTFSPNVTGYTSYDEVNDRFILCDYNWNYRQHAAIYDCATQTVTASIEIGTLNTSHYSIWMNAYSPADNSYYFAFTTYSPLFKIDAATFSSSFSPISCEIVISPLSGSGLMMIRGASDKVSIFDPISQSIVHNQPDLPSSGLFEGGGVGDVCTNVFVATIDTQNGPSMAAMTLLDRNTYLPVNYLTVNSNVPAGFGPDGWYQYGITFNPSDSRVYSAQHSYDTDEGRLYSVRLSRAITPLSWSVPYTPSAADTASCMWYSSSFKITSSNPGPTEWMGRAYPNYITSDGYTILVSDNEYLLDTSKQHNRHNWFFDANDPTIRYNDYTESYVHTWPGRNAVVCNGKYYMLSDGLFGHSVFGEAITASAMLVFDSTGSLLSTIPLTYGGMDWDTDGTDIWVYEHDGTNIYLEQITGSTDTIINTQPIYDSGFAQMKLSGTASFNNGLDFGYYSGKMLSFNNGSQWSIVNLALQNSGIESGSGDLLTGVLGGYYAGYNYQLSMADDGFSGYGGWTGGLEYCPLTNTVFIGAWSAAPDYTPLVIETNPDLSIVRTYDLSDYTGSFFGVDDIKWNRKKRVLELFNYYSSTPGEILVLDPVARQVVCNINPLNEIPIGASSGHSVGVNPLTGKMYVPQRFDGDVSAYTGSVKIYDINPLVMP